MTRIRTMVAATALALFAFAGCAGSGGGTYRGVQLYEKGEGIYVCREAHTASTRDTLVEKLRSGDTAGSTPTGQSVSIVSRDSADVGGETVSLSQVEAADGGRRYWIPYTALCSRSGG